jgi:hypothetical protein
MTWNIQRMEALDAMRQMATASVGCVITEGLEPGRDATPEGNAALLSECLRVSSGPVVWVGVPTVSGRTSLGLLDPVPDIVAHWVIQEHGRIRGLAPVYAWHVGRKQLEALAFCDWVIYGDISEVRPSNDAEYHTGEKPLTLGRHLVSVFGSSPVLDPMCGSGTFGVASLLAGLDFIGIDRDARSVDMAWARMSAIELERCVTVEGIET